MVLELTDEFEPTAYYELDSVHIVHVANDGNDYPCDLQAVFYLQLYPKPNIFFKTHGALTALVGKEGKVSKLTTDAGQTLEAYCVDCRFSVSEHIWEPSFTPFLLYGDDDTKLTKIDFYLCNFFDNKYDINLETSQWKIKISKLDKIHERLDYAKFNSYFVITHRGTITLTSSSIFSGKQASDICLGLTKFLSFCTGASCKLVCPVGFDGAKKPVWGQYQPPSSLWGGQFHWFDPTYPNQLTELFPLFMFLWGQERWQERLKEIVDWYIAANYSRLGVEQAIVAAQAALEKLAYEYAVNETESISAKDFNKVSAAAKLRAMLAPLNIPFNIESLPKSLREYNESKVERWEDAVHAITDVRNSLIHSVRKLQGLSDQVLLDTWHITVWFIEMGVLAICGYNGKYLNRRERPVELGSSDIDVPWTLV